MNAEVNTLFQDTYVCYFDIRDIKSWSIREKKKKKVFHLLNLPIAL